MRTEFSDEQRDILKNLYFRDIAKILTFICDYPYLNELGKHPHSVMEKIIFKHLKPYNKELVEKIVDIYINKETKQHIYSNLSSSVYFFSLYFYYNKIDRPYSSKYSTTQDFMEYLKNMKENRAIKIADSLEF